MKYVLIKEGEKTDLLYRAKPNPPIINEADMASFRDRFFNARGDIEKALSEKWDEEHDFAVEWDFDYYYSLAGGIYSERIYCIEYINTILNVLNTLPGNDPWVYHTVCEIEVNPNGKTMAESVDFRGEFYLFKETLLVFESDMNKANRIKLGLDS